MDVDRVIKAIKKAEEERKDKVIRIKFYAANQYSNTYKVTVTDAISFVDKVIEKIPMLHDERNQVFIKGLLRWHIEGDVNLNSNEDCAKINTFLLVFLNGPAKDAYNENFASFITYRPESFEQLKAAVNVNVDSPANDAIEGAYSVVRINSYKQLLDYEFFASNWCIVSAEEVYNDYTLHGKNKLFLVVRSNYKDVKPTPGNQYPKDSFGTSLIAVIVDENDCISSITTRWNNTGEFNNPLSINELEAIIGLENMMKLH